jgi:hypothetical protein
MNDAGAIGVRSADPAQFPRAPASPRDLVFHEPALARLRELIESHIAEGRCPGAQIALARAGYQSQGVSSAGWTDHQDMRRQVCDFTLD